MDERTRRVGHNEGLFRQINEQIEAFDRGIAQIADQTLHIVCECGDLRCQDRIVVPLSVYERVRAESVLFLVVPGHVFPHAEDVVEKSGNYFVVRKLDGAPARLAEVTDPRA